MSTNLIATLHKQFMLDTLMVERWKGFIHAGFVAQGAEINIPLPLLCLMLVHTPQTEQPHKLGCFLRLFSGVPFNVILKAIKVKL